MGAHSAPTPRPPLPVLAAAAAGLIALLVFVALISQSLSVTVGSLIIVGCAAVILALKLRKRSTRR